MPMGGRGIRVLIVGGGIGGLCLAQGLRKAGVDFTVYERDTAAGARQQGYRLRISPEGEAALRACLPPALQELLTVTGHRRGENGLDAYDEQLRPQWTPQFDDPRGDRPDRVDAVDRDILRRILLAGLEDRVRFGRTVVGCEHLPGGRVAARFADGSTAEGDVLVAADGANSQVRGRLLPTSRPTDLGVRTVFSRIAREDAVRAGLPEPLQDRFSYVIGADSHLGLMPMSFRSSPRQAAARLWPGLELPDSGDYYMVVLNVHRDDLGISDQEFFALDGPGLCRFAAHRTAAWHPGLRGLFHHARADLSFGVALRAQVPVTGWDTFPVVPLGDAVHTMPPSGGVGANTAVRDAAALTGALAAVDRGGRDAADAVAEYQKAMAVYATEGVEMSLRIARWSIKKVDAVAGAGEHGN
ncbi:FAD-dependent monooxygenase [Streptomyces morookaense]|uniref:FAD-dependent monooxygenase n=2 Tax=Streptomyces morookaense TaxID=1970 RepID=A0A7Y7B1W2_STRMO|nr:FAD-dependent monooxygenase [Streptomyces morookaense]